MMLGNRVAWATQLVRRGERRPWQNVKLLTGGGIIAIVVLVAVFAFQFAPYSPYIIDVSHRFQPPTWQHWAGTDEYGRDLLSRVIVASRTSVEVSVISVAIGLMLGIPIGIFAARDNKVLDLLLMRFMDILYAFPAILLAIAVMAGLGPTLTNAMIAIGIIFIAPVARLSRAAALSVLRNQFIEAARAMGMKTTRILMREMFPNIVPPLLIQTTQLLALGVLLEAALSFLGIGVQPPQPTWGNMLNDARGFLSQDPWLLVGPGVALFITILGLNLAGDGLRDVLDPKLRV